MKLDNFIMAFAVIASLSLNSCSQEEELLVSNHSSIVDPDAVMFDTYMSKAPKTRGAALDNAAIQTQGFGVFGYLTGQDNFTGGESNTAIPNFMCNQLVKWDGTPTEESDGMWAYSPMKYWPTNTDDKLSFFAYAPYTDKAAAEGQPGITSMPSNSTAGDPKLGYTLPQNAGDQIDLLYSAPMIDLLKQNVDQKVQFNFSHAMTRIGFKRVIEVDETNPDYENSYDEKKKATNALADGTTVTITKVSLTSTEFYKSGSLNLCTGEWEGLSKETQTYTLTGDDFTEAGRTATKDNSQNPVQLNNEDKYLMIFPSRTTESMKYIPIDITVEFDVTTKDPNIAGGESKITSSVTSSFEFEFLKGKYYNFVLHIGLTSVKLESQVSDWNHIWDEQDNQDLEGEVVVNSPNNNCVSLIYDANGGRFLNGSSQYIVTAPIGNFAETDEDAAGHDRATEARFFVREFTMNKDIFWVKPDGDSHNYDFFGWVDQKFTHKDYIENFMDEETGEMLIPVYYGGEAIYVKKTDSTASRTIYAWWPGEETVL